jgi:spore maturation protein CgeB
MDLIFVGSGRGNRRQFLQDVAAACRQKGYSFQVNGPRFTNSHLKFGQAAMFRRNYPDLDRVLVGGKMNGEAINELYSRSKICLGNKQPNQQGLPFRTFEALGAGVCFLTEHSTLLGKHFTDGIHLSIFKDLPELILKLDYLMGNPATRESMAEKGRAAVEKEHLMAHRVAKILEVVKELNHQKYRGPITAVQGI